MPSLRNVGWCGAGACLFVVACAVERGPLEPGNGGAGEAGREADAGAPSSSGGAPHEGDAGGGNGGVSEAGAGGNGGDGAGGDPNAAGGGAGERDTPGGAGAFSDGSSGAAGNAAECADEPVDVLVLLDRSASMQDPPSNPDGSAGTTPKWDLLVAPLLDALEASPPSVRWGLKVFPEGDFTECAAGSVTGDVDVPFGQASEVVAAIEATAPQGNGTPTGDAVKRAAEYLAAANDDRPKFILLITDGQPSCAGVTDTTDGSEGAEAARSYTVDALADAHAHGFSSFVVALGTNSEMERDTLNAMSEAGGRPAPALNPLDTLFYLGNVEADVTHALEAALSGATACTAPPLPAIALPYSEDFEDGNADGFLLDADAAFLGAEWSVFADGSDHVYAPNQVYADPSLVVGGDRRWDDVRITASVAFTGAQSEEGSASLVARFRENGAGYYLEYEADGYVRVRARAGGFTTDLVARTAVAAAGSAAHELSLVVQGADVSIFVDGALVGSATDPSPLEPGGIALGATESVPWFDDLRVSAP